MYDRDQGKPNLKYFIIAYIIALTILLLRMPPIGDLVWMAGNDDAMRLVQVRDFMAGQGWADLMQYRLGPEGGTLMHWSRLIDVPIAALIRVFSVFMPVSGAETATMIVWPLFLAGVLLWVMQRASIRFGGKQAEVTGLFFSLIALISSSKFAPGLLDHHNVQMVAMAIILWAMMAGGGAFAGAIAGVTGAVSVAMGLEVVPFIVAVCLFVGLKWMWVGALARPETLGFSAGFGGGLWAVFWVTQPDFTATMFRCDALGFDIVLLGSFGGFGLLAIAALASKLPVIVRAVSLLGLGVAIILVARVYAPACLANPLDQLYPDVSKYWLGRVTEAQTMIASLKLGGRNFGMLFVPAIAIIYAAILGRNRNTRSRAIFLALVVAAFWAMSFYQIRGLYFVLLLCVLPVSAMLGLLYERYRVTGSTRAGILGIMAALISIPGLWADLYEAIPKGAKFAEDTATSLQVSGMLSVCFSPEATQVLADLPKGLVASGVNMGSGVLNVTKHRVLSSNFHRNQDGIQAGLDLAFADMDAAKELLHQWGVDYVVYCKNDQYSMTSGDDPDGLWLQLFRGDVPDFLTRVSAHPDDMIQIFATTHKQGATR